MVNGEHPWKRAVLTGFIAGFIGQAILRLIDLLILKLAG
ncbi:hypothetical protein HMPREF1091_00238 [Atopobium minutum 10063974]|uniref:Uncharacterized protein n=1 Tax=Atopobium minutum 10063974 TaxID=997872 RepID=N2BVS4_9ACTN|nr:hypothetical protein HMPREF1091_00238 [Atopobium minutum 10063974]